MRLLRSVLRIALAVASVCVLLLMGLGWALRQPNFGRLPFPGTRRADPARLEAHVRFLATTAPSRNWRDVEGTERAAGYIAQTLAATSARCSEQRHRAHGTEFRNLIASFGPESGARVVVGAHYDSFGRLPGADDNASGVAGVLELARLLDGVALSRSVQLVAFSTEEPPFFGGAQMGSAVHARSLAASRTPVRAMICLEMIGFYASDQREGPFLLRILYPRRGNFVSVVGRWSDRALLRQAKKAFRGASHVPVVSYSGPVGLGSDLSDHRNYWAEGFPALMVTDTAFLRNRNYHMASDTAETLDYRAMAGVVDGVLGTVVHLANE